MLDMVLQTSKVSFVPKCEAKDSNGKDFYTKFQVVRKVIRPQLVSSWFRAQMGVINKIYKPNSPYTKVA